MKNDEVIYAAPRFLKESHKTPYSSPQLNPMDAVRAAAQDLHLAAPQDLRIRTVTDEKSFELNTGNISIENIPVQLVYVLTKTNRLKLAWDLSIHTTDGANWWSVKIDAATGELLELNDWVLTCTFPTHDHKIKNTNTTRFKRKSPLDLYKNVLPLVDASYRVFALPLVSPQEGDRTLIINPADELASPFGWHDIDGIEGAEFTTTEGNNVSAEENIRSLDFGGKAAEGGENLNFDILPVFSSKLFSSVTVRIRKSCGAARWRS